MKAIHTLGLIINFYKEDPIMIGKKMIGWLQSKGLTVIATGDDALALDLQPLTLEQFCTEAEVVLVVGGDGTLLRAARTVYEYEIPILGINQGYLGFLTEIEIKEMDIYLEKILQGEYATEKRMMLTARVYRNQSCIAEVSGLNDLVITKGGLARMISVEISLENGMVDRYLGDGVIFSTPTGSTGYSLSAGGPIVYPNFDLCLITPVCPHSLSARSIILPTDKLIKIILGTDNFQAMLTVDGQKGVELEHKDEIIIQKADFDTYFVKLKDRNFFQVMREKLKSASGNKYMD